MPLRLRKLWLVLSIVAVLTVAAAPRRTAPGVSVAANAPYSPTEVLVRFRPGASANAVTQALAAGGGQAQTNPALAKLGYTLVSVPNGQVLAALASLSQNPAVERAEPNYILTVADGGLADTAQPDTIPTDPAWSLQYGPVHIQMPQLWDILTGTTAITIAIIDTGVDLLHPDLVDKFWTNPGETGLDGSSNDKRTNLVDDDGDGYIDDWRGWDFTSAGLGDNYPQDAYGHGTHVAGIAGAATNNGMGIAGVNWNAPLMVVRVLGDDGNGSEAQVAAGMVYATDRGARIINLSLGGYAPSTPLEDAVNYAYNHGVLVVAAAGNNGPSVIYPARYEHALAVAATNASDTVPSFSNAGPEVDVAAPGAGIYSTCYAGSLHVCKSTYGYLDGTSMATPHVAGVAALLATLPQFNTPDKIRAALESTALDLAPSGRDDDSGYGLIQAYAAALFDPANVTPTPPPVQYTTYTSESCGGAGYNWLSAAGGTNTGISSDEGTAQTALPFTFMFRGQPKTSALLTANGYLTFSGVGTSYTNAPIPSTAVPNDFIAPFWDDLNPSAGGAIFTQTFGSAPNRSFIIEWNNVPRYSDTGALTFQVVLTEGANTIRFQYQALTATNPAYASGGSATVGLEFAGGTSGVPYSYNSAGSLHAGLAVLFSPDTAPAPDCGATPTPVTWLAIPNIEN